MLALSALDLARGRRALRRINLLLLAVLIGTLVAHALPAMTADRPAQAGSGGTAQAWCGSC